MWYCVLHHNYTLGIYSTGDCRPSNESIDMCGRICKALVARFSPHKVISQRRCEALPLLLGSLIRVAYNSHMTISAIKLIPDSTVP